MTNKEIEKHLALTAHGIGTKAANSGKTTDEMYEVLREVIVLIIQQPKVK
jgi:hypothetical protein